MPRRHPALPTLWLLTDERQGDALWAALAALPRGSGVVFRHHRTAEPARAHILARVARIAAHRQLILAHETVSPLRVVLPRRPGVAGATWIARVHAMREAKRARQMGAVALFVSPVFPTRTHPGQPALGPVRAARIARAARLPAIALGGVTSHRFKRLKTLGFHGWAAIDGLVPIGQKRKAVPI